LTLKVLFISEGVDGQKSNEPVPARKKEKANAIIFLNCNCISPESPGRRLIEETEFSFLPERAYWSWGIAYIV
jgi:hypothetical protein